MARYGLPIVLPITRIKRGYPTHVELEGVLPVTSYVQCEQIRTLSSRRLIRPLAFVDGVAMARVDLILRRILQL